MVMAWCTVQTTAQTKTVVIGWNDLGMHCMDGRDESVFSLLPPFNTIHAQVIQDGRLATGTNSLAVTYEAVADPQGSINTTSQGKVNFWDFAQVLYGMTLAPDMGLGGYAMPGPGNHPQKMGFSSALKWFSAEGIPIVPYDDAGQNNPYPMLRLTARNAAGTGLAHADIVLPVSDEMDCRTCHQSGASPEAKPRGGWVWHYDRQKDYKLNILRLHDENLQFNNYYAGHLAQAGYDTNGLYATVQQGQPILCARCHQSNALPGSGHSRLTPLTQAIHDRHTYATDPTTGLVLNASGNRSACYRCHPGSDTRCLRGAMGSAVGPDGRLAMQCQSCHGAISRVAAASRTGWLDEPQCQSCHTGDAVTNRGLLRYTSVFDASNQVRQAASTRFATQTNVPSTGFSLYRFSQGHGGLACSACHGPPHAEYPSSEPNDNVQSQALQGHGGVVSECTVCHPAMPNTANGGPHGLHELGQAWVGAHPGYAERNGTATCKPCHGADYRGTVLSQALADRTLNAMGTKRFWRGFQIGCYTCHNGPSSDNTNPNRAPAVQNGSLQTTYSQPASVNLGGTDADGNTLVFRIVTQPVHGTVGLSNRVATYYPENGYTGADSFTFAARDGSTDSNLGTMNVTVTAGLYTLESSVLAPTQAAARQTIPFWARLKTSAPSVPVEFNWDFGDNTAPGRDQYATHVYAAAGAYQWQLVVQAGGLSSTNQGTVEVSAVTDAPVLQAERQGSQLVLSWPGSLTGFILQSTSVLGPQAAWSPAPEPAVLTGGQYRSTHQFGNQPRYFRLARP
jgi:hypothetical protein